MFFLWVTILYGAYYPLLSFKYFQQLYTANNQTIYCMQQPCRYQRHLSCLYICLLRFTLSTGYYGLSLNTSQLHANPYISCFISAAVEVPAYVSSWMALRYCQRRPSVICILLLGATSLYFIQLVPEGMIPFPSKYISNTNSCWKNIYSHNWGSFQ